MTALERAEILSEAAERIALLNEFRTDDFQDQVARLVNEASGHWRDAEGDLPAAGADPMLDALNALVDESDGSPTAMRDACAAALRVAEGPRAAP